MVGLYETAVDALSARTEGDRTVRPKIVASTATVRSAQAQVRALFARSDVRVFPPPGPDRATSFFAESLPLKSTKLGHPRTYLGVAAPGRSMKVLLLRAYVTLLGAAQRAFEDDPASADPYMSLVGYFNSLRELGGARRIVEDEVRNKLARADRRRRAEGRAGDELLAARDIAYDCVELTSRESTERIKVAKERLEVPFTGSSAKGAKKPTARKDRPAVDVALASNMISVGLDIERLGLMVVCGQPKTAAEYIQASSRVGRAADRPGLVVTLLNVHRPRDRSHLEHFEAYHQSFYRAVEATSVTPFSPRAIDRGLAGVAVALARLGEPSLTPADGAGALGPVKTRVVDFVAETLVVGKPQGGAAVSGYIVFGQAPLPEIESFLRGNAPAHCVGCAVALHSERQATEFEECEIHARRAVVVAKEEMPDIGHVLIDSALDELQPQQARVEINTSSSVDSYARDVVKAVRNHLGERSGNISFG
jgi:hypothetical protein